MPLTSVAGQTEKKTAVRLISAPGKKWKSPIFVQKSIDRMSAFGGKAEVFREAA